MGSAVSTATAAAARSTTLLLAAGADEVSTHIAALFSTHGLQYQLASAQAAEFHERFVLTLAADANTYLTTEIANAQRCLAGAINAPPRRCSGTRCSAPTRRPRPAPQPRPPGVPRWRPRRQAPGLRSRGPDRFTIRDSSPSCPIWDRHSCWAFRGRVRRRSCRDMT
ncbi:PE family protein [Mycobacterium liflandii]|uniref:PE family protein n=1 Tax=Mycobacterium liflandii TaxID=261524 RepID=UPI002989D9E1|nr:PE family protein [Mycobacterium liflandii]